MITAGNQYKSDLSEVLFKFNFRFEKYLIVTGRVIKNFLGLVGLHFIMLAALVSFISPSLYVVLRIYRSRMEREANKIINGIPNTSPRELVQIHLIVERFKNKWPPSIDRHNLIRVPGTIRFLLIEIYRYHETIIKLEKTLFRAAYPDIDIAPSLEELDYMREQIADYEIDLQDPSLDEYEEYYLS